MRIMKYLVVSFLLTASAGAWAGEILWGNAESGMTAEQVKKLYPNAVSPLKPSTLHDGAEALLSLEDLELQGKLFQVQFYFLNGALTQTTLRLSDRLNRFDASHLFDSLRESLTAKYGRSFSEKNSRYISSFIREANWMSGSTNINMILLLGGNPVLNINYQRRVTQEMDKL